MSEAPWSREELRERLRTVGAARYHDRHPFHRAMNAGELTREQVRGWILNRYCYQRAIPLKDAAILSNCPVREVRRLWIHRVQDHDGTATSPGGLEAWLKLADAAGIPRPEMERDEAILPAVRFAVDAYVNYCRSQPWPLAVAASLTEMFAPDLMAERIRAFEKHYTWLDPEGLSYFRSRVTRARADSVEGFDLVAGYCDTRLLQVQALSALQFKCDVLWSLLDAILLAYGAGSRQ